MTNYRIFVEKLPRFQVEGRKPAARVERQPEPFDRAAAPAERLRPVRLQRGAARKEPLRRLRRDGDRQRDRRLRPRGPQVRRRGVPPGTVRPAGRLGRRLRAPDRPCGRRADPLVETAPLRRRGDGCRAGQDQALLHQRRGVAREGSLAALRPRTRRGEARAGARRVHGDGRRRAGRLPQASGAGDERRRPARGGRLFPRRGPRSVRDGAAHPRHLLERPLPPYDLHHGTRGHRRRGVVREVGDRGVAGPLPADPPRAGPRAQEHLPDGHGDHRRPLPACEGDARRSGGLGREQRLLGLCRRRGRRADRKVADAVQKRNAQPSDGDRSPSEERLDLVWAVRSATRCRAAATSIRRCA